MPIQLSTKECSLSAKSAFPVIYLAPVFLVLLFFFFLTGCNKKPEYLPGSSVQGIRAPIAKVLFSPIAYDGAVLKLEGIITELTIEKNYGEEDSTDEDSRDEDTPDAPDDASADVDGYDESVEEDDITTLFKLRDLQGNYINIILPGSWDIYEDEYIIVGGTYRKNENELEARQFEMMVFDKEDEQKEIQKRDEW